MTVIQPNGFFGWTCARCGMFVAGDGPHYCGVLPASPHSRLVTATATALVNLIAEKDARIAELEAELAKFKECENGICRDARGIVCVGEPMVDNQGREIATTRTVWHKEGE